jgi:hypothetical protein
MKSKGVDENLTLGGRSKKTTAKANRSFNSNRKNHITSASKNTRGILACVGRLET